MSAFQQHRSTPARPDAPSEASLAVPPGRRSFAIGEMARDFGVIPRALRFYETRRMLKPHRRGSTRFYTPGDRERLATILRGKELGFSLREIRAMLAGATAAADAPLPLSAPEIADQLAMLEAQGAAIERAIAHLQDYAAAMRRPEAEEARRA